MSAEKRQTSDSAQKGPGVKTDSLKQGYPTSTPSGISPSGNSTSGSSQSDSRGKQGDK